MRQGLVWSTLSTLILSVSLAHADEDATRWLQRMSQAAHTLNYVGTFVYMQEGRLETMQLVHAVDGDGERERLVSLSGPNREVIREQGRVTCYLPEKDALVAEHPTTPPGFPLNLPTQWEQLRNVYDFKLLEVTRVAGMSAQQVAIIPKDGLRYGQNYWIASDSGLLLRSDVVNEQGEVVEQLEFTSLTLHDQIPAQQLRPEVGGQAINLTPKPEALMTESKSAQHWRVANLPSGFELELQRQHAMSDGGVAVEHLIYSDGLASVSVFIEPRRGEAEQLDGISHRGSVNAYTRMLPEQQITVLGEVPLATVKQIGESLEPLVR